MAVKDIIVVTRIKSMTHIKDTNPEIQKNNTTHTTNTEKDYIIDDNKLIKIQIIKTRIIFIA